MWFESCSFCMWGLLCVIAFAAMYADKEIRCNADMDGQWRCLSGVILENRPMMTFFLSNFAGSAVMGLLLLSRDNDTVAYAGILLFELTMGLLCFDIIQFRAFHMAFLAGLLAAACVITHATPTTTVTWLLPACDATLILLAGSLVLNVFVMKNKPPYLSIQAVCEILWAACLASWFANQLLLE